MFIKKDLRKIPEIVVKPDPDGKDHTRLKLARRAPEFPAQHTGEVLSEASAESLAGIKLLNLYQNGLSRLKGFSVLARLGALEELNLGYNKLRDESITPALGQVASLRKLWLEDNLLTVLPPPLLRLTHLTHLRLTGNSITSLPEGISRLSSLEELAVDSNGLSSLPAALGALPRLRVLLLRGNALSSLPETLGRSDSLLTTVSLSTNALRRLPHSLGQCSHLSSLSLNCNALLSLPSSFAGLGRLRHLNASSNCLQYLPLPLVDAWAASLPAGVVARAPMLIYLAAVALADAAAGGGGSGGSAVFPYKGKAGVALEARVVFPTPAHRRAALQRLCKLTGAIVKLSGADGGADGGAGAGSGARGRGGGGAGGGGGGGGGDEEMEGAADRDGHGGAADYLVMRPEDLDDIDLRAALQESEYGLAEGGEESGELAEGGGGDEDDDDDSTGVGAGAAAAGGGILGEGLGVGGGDEEGEEGAGAGPRRRRRGSAAAAAAAAARAPPVRPLPACCSPDFVYVPGTAWAWWGEMRRPSRSRAGGGAGGGAGEGAGAGAGAGAASMAEDGGADGQHKMGAAAAEEEEDDGNGEEGEGEGEGEGEPLAPYSPLPKFELNIDVNPLLRPALGVGAMHGGDMTAAQYQVPLVQILREKIAAGKKH